MKTKGLLILAFFMIQLLGRAQCLEGDCENGYGVLKCDCGYTYKGYFENGMKVKGTLIKADLVYTGTFEYDVANGYGLIRYADGAWYEGEFKDNQPHGYGKYQYSSGETYLGQFENGRFQGLGVLLVFQEDSVIRDFEIGMFADDALNGVGYTKYLNGNTFLGNHKNGEHVGYGIFIHEADHVAEIGLFKPARNVKNVVLLDYPNVGDIQAKPLQVKGVNYSASGHLDGTNLLIASTTKEQQMYYYYDSATQLFFISNGPASEGYAINLQGEIYNASLVIEPQPSVRLGKLVHQWEAQVPY